MKTLRRRTEQGFTLIEITAVLILLAAVVAIAGPQILKAIDGGQHNAVVTQVGNIRNCLTQYRLENGVFPTTEQGLAALYTRPTVPPVPDTWDGPYSDKPISKDVWKHDYYYRCPGEHNPDSYDLADWGKDGAEGGKGVNADITNWTAGE